MSSKKGIQPKPIPPVKETSKKGKSTKRYKQVGGGQPKINKMSTLNTEKGNMAVRGRVLCCVK